MKRMRVMKCKFCDNRFDNPDQFVSHLESNHANMIPSDMTPYQFFYYLKTGKDCGKCVTCGSTHKRWNTKTNKYYRFCTNKECERKYVEMFKQRMIGKYGKVTLLNEPEHQKKMLQNRKISGIYTWTDNIHQTPYTGSYELSFLKFLDEIMNFSPEDIIAPSPHTYYYQYENKKHFYIPDFFIPSLSLEIEIKDGGNNMNKHPKIQAIDKVKERLKDEVMKSNQNNFNYIKIINKENERFFKYLELAKYNFANGIDKPIFMI
jgi:hypothetical protein